MSAAGLPSDAAVQSKLDTHHQRLDIQGLRAVAVLSVVANHLWDWPAGGFVGVDVFFVVSGFLITGLLLREHERAGRISFVDFYRRRARRILPAAVTVLVVTVAATYLLVNSARGAQVRTDATWSLLFAANWRFAELGTDYFQNDLVSPVQHYWSLAVEEQFYLGWPILIVLVLGFFAKQGNSHRMLLLTVGVLSAASFAYSLWHTGLSPTWAYFSTFDRIWELGLGASIALVRPSLTKIGAGSAAALGWGGFSVILASFFVIDSTARFPAPWAAMPVLGTVLVLVGGVGHPQRHLVPLVNPVATYVGDISYSLYLWHFPVVILGASLYPAAGIPYYLAAVALMGVLSVISYHLIELPVRESGWLEPKSSRRLPPDDRRRRRLQNQWLALGAGLTAMMVAISLMPREPPNTVSLPPLDSTTGRKGETLLEQQQARVTAALETRSFPAFDPALDTLGFDNWATNTKRTGCMDVTEDNLEDCRFGEPAAERLAFVMGDSHAMSWMPTIRAALPDNWQVQQLTLQQCPTWNVPVDYASGGAYDECADWNEWAQDQVIQSRPDLVIMTTSSQTISRLSSKNEGGEASDEIRGGLRSTLDQISNHVDRLAVLSSPPIMGPLQGCVTSRGTPEDCVRTVTPEWTLVSEAEAAAAVANPRTTYIDSRDWFCYLDRCPAFVGVTPVTVDGSHLTPQYAEAIAPLLEEALRPVLRAGR